MSKLTDNWPDIASYVRENWPEETKHILRVADEVCRNYFLFDLPWDMERTYEPVCFEEKIDWEYMPGDDPEFIYQMNRHRYFICLGQAYALTGEERYAENFVRLMMDWCENVPLNEESRKTTWRSIEAGIRGEYWTKAFRYFAESPSVTEAVKAAWLDCLNTHGEYLMESFGSFQISSNWGVLESHGLYLIGCELGRKDWQQTALERLKLEAGIQIAGDGVHWEQSAMYHNEVLLCYMEVLAWQLLTGREPEAFLLDTVEKMALADLAWKKPDGRQPLYGDSDDTDLREILSRAAWLLEQGGREDTACQLKFGGYERLDYESCWDYGLQAVHGYEKLAARMPDHRNYSLDDSGNYIVRSGWEEKADYLRFRNGYMGGGHGHTDKLHFSFCWNGEDVLVDAGRYRYVFDDDRVWFKGAGAHNTILVDGQDYVRYTDSWTTKNSMPEIRSSIMEKEGYILLEGGHTGYLAESGVLLSRRILVLEEGLYLVIDEALTEGAHTYERYFHLKEGASLKASPGGIDYRGEGTTGRIWLDGQSKWSERRSKISRHYNQYQENSCIEAACGGEGSIVMSAVFSKGEDALSVEERPVRSRVAGCDLEAAGACAWHIEKGDRSYDVIYRRQDIAGSVVLLESGSCLGIGRILAAGPDQRTVSFC